MLRQFFRRVKNYDEKILSQLVRFYLYAHVGGPWPTERLDKVDFLLARLSEEVDDRSGELVLRDHQRLSEIFQGIWAQLGEAPPGDQLIEERRAAIDGVRHEMGGIESLDALNESALIRRYRELKHGLGNFYFHPELLLAIQETNLVFKSRIQKLYRQEEQRIVAEYQRVFELEREVPFDTNLDRELGAFREEIERFEKQLQKEEFRLGDIAQIRQKVRDLLPRLNAGRAATGDRPSVSRMGQDTGEYTLSQAAGAAAAPMRRATRSCWGTTTAAWSTPCATSTRPTSPRSASCSGPRSSPSASSRARSRPTAGSSARPRPTASSSSSCSNRPPCASASTRRRTTSAACSTRPR